MGTVQEAIRTTPIIDHHAHNLLLPSKSDVHNLLSMTSEATGSALDHSTSALAHLRAVKQLARILACEPTWDRVKKAIEVKRQQPNDAWAKQCFTGIETVLIDDGLDPSDVHPYDWHDRLVPTQCKRIVRIERVAEDLITQNLVIYRKQKSSSRQSFGRDVVSAFVKAIENAIADPIVAGFKSIICYRAGLAVPAWDDTWVDQLLGMLESHALDTVRLEDISLNSLFVHITAKTIGRSNARKPFQFHTGLGDNDINLGLSNPSHLQLFIEAYPEVNIVLLHASYPFTTEAGYLASVYKNTYLDIGEIFPFVSQDGQEGVIRSALDLCPSEKLLWSTDGHWFPETYLLAVVQMKEGLERVLNDYVERGALNVTQAIRIVRDLFFMTSNRIYELGLSFAPADSTSSKSLLNRACSQDTPWAANLALFKQFLAKSPSVKFLRLQWIDYTSTLRTRILTVTQALKMFHQTQFLGITKAVLGLLQTDEMCPGFYATGEYRLYPCFEGLRLASRPGHATVQCEFQSEDGTEVDICPRTVLRRQVERARAIEIEFLVGFEIEVVFMRRTVVDGEFKYGGIPVNEGGHAWSTARALQSGDLMDLLETIVSELERVGIELQQFHPESSPGQYEFVLAPLSPLDAVDALLAAREVISLAAANAHMRATLHPKPFKLACGTGAHIHISMTPEPKWPNFYAGILENLAALAAILYSNAASYERVTDGLWAGSTWIAWGPQNRETPLRQIQGSHFEIKCVDGFANPYLALAAIVGAGLQGIRKDLPLRMKPCFKDPATLSETEKDSLGMKQKFPENLAAALANFSSANDIVDTLGGAFVETYVNVKEKESDMLNHMEPERKRNWLIERY